MRPPCVSSVTAFATRRPPAGACSRRPRRRRHRCMPPPMKTASGIGRPASAAGAGPSTTSRSGTPSAAALRRCAPRARRALRSATARFALARQHPLDADRAGAGADVPQHFARPRRQGGERQRADLRLGELAVALEKAVVEARSEGYHLRICGRDDGDCDECSAARSAQDRTHRPASAARARADRPSLRAPRVRTAETPLRKQRREAGRGRAVPGQSQYARARLQMRHDPLEGSAVQADAGAVGNRPAEPRRREAEGRGRGRHVISSAASIRASSAPTP